MASWYSNILTTTTSRISNLRSTLLGGDADGDTEDDTHVCRVLRAYYTEKGRAFPPWLPPDPKAPPPPVATPVPSVAGVGSRYGGGGLTGSVSQGSGLSSLWDNSGGGGGGGNAAGGARPGRPGAAANARLSPFANNRNSDPVRSDDYLSAAGGGGGGARPLPSQRMGSYQSTQSAAAALDRGSGAGTPVGSAQDKLRNLFGAGGAGAGGSRSNSPAQYGSGGRGGGGGDRPFVAANAPWATDEYQYSGGGGGGGGRSAGRLPSGPRRGLPSGPRMR